MLAASMAIVALTFPIAYRRLMVSTLEYRSGAARRGLARTMQGLLIRAADPVAGVLRLN